ncbi:LysR family transcriptional regulator [Burkholderia cenocepacia]|nr:LysR family transcriptional regulator [Burkholderia cenocepacia]
MDTLQNMRIFVRVVEAGGFTAAASQLNVSTPVVSRALSDLETHLRTRLLNRTTRRLALTEAGGRYLQRCRQVLELIDEAEAEAGDACAKPSGKLRLHSMASFGQHYLVPLVSRYRELYPGVVVELTLAQRVPDLLEEGYDLSVVLAHQLPDSGLVSQRLGTVPNVPCASREYARKNGLPDTVADLSRHSCLRLIAPATAPGQWIFRGADGQETHDLGASAFTVNVAEAMAIGIREGLGIGVLPGMSAIVGLREGWLVRVLPQYTMQQTNVYALYPSRQYLDAKIRTWVGLLQDELCAVLSADAAVLA